MNSQHWLTQVIRMRKKLMASNKSLKSSLNVASDLVFLERHLSANRYSVLTFASFFIRHSDKIYNLLPGEGAGNHDKLVTDFNSILDESNTIINSKKTVQC